MDAFFETFKDIFDKVIDFVNFILKLPSFLIEYLDVLPQDIKYIFIPVVVVIISIFLYKLVR